MSRLKSAAVKDIDIDIADISLQKYRYRIDIGNGDIGPPLLCCIQDYCNVQSKKFQNGL